MNRYDFSGRTALVTGGANGIGREVCRRLGAGGAAVATFDLAAGDDAVDLALTGDVTSPEDLREAERRITEVYGQLDVLVCCAGVFGTPAATVDVPDSTWERTLAVNATGTYYAIRAVVAGMVARGYGRIVTLASIAAKEGLTQGDAYAASKAAVVSITRTVGRDLAQTGVLINCVIPALIETDMASALSPAQHEHAVARIPMGRLGRPGEVATLIAFLASEDLSFSTGACFDVTGGRASW